MRERVPGILLAAALAAAAFLLSRALAGFVTLDAALLGLLLGLAAGNLLRHPATLEPGASWLSKRGLEIGIVLLGVEVNLAFLLAAGPKLLALVLVLVAATMLAFLLMGRALGLRGDAPALLGTGTAICGLSAVAAAGATLRSPKEDVSVAVASVGLLSALGLVLYPLVGFALDLDATTYGAWAGLSLHAVANAVAAGFALGPEAGEAATLAKLARVALLAPLLLALVLLRGKRGEGKVAGAPLLPWTVWGFLLVVLVVSLLPPPAWLAPWLKLLLKAVLVLAITAVGYATRLGDFRRAGARGMALAVAGWVLLSVAALAGALLLDL